MKKSTAIINLVCLLIPLLVLGQNQDVNQDIYNLFDNLVGVDNTGIYNGLEYNDNYKTLGNNHPNFVSSNFLNGFIEYNGQSYYNINLKYNLNNQEIIAKLKSNNTSETIIKLNKNSIGSFIINNQKFINISLKETGFSGFYEEVLIDTDLILLIKHQKFKKDLYQNEQMYIEFVPAKKSYVIFYNNNYSELDSKKDVTNLFPELKQKINQFYIKNRSLRKTNNNQFLIQLLQELNLFRHK